MPLVPPSFFEHSHANVCLSRVYIYLVVVEAGPLALGVMAARWDILQARHKS